MMETIVYLSAFMVWCILPQVALGLIFDAQIEYGIKPPESEKLPPPQVVPKDPLFAMMRRLSEQEKLDQERDELIKLHSEGL